MLEVANVAAFNKAVSDWLIETEDFVTRVFRGYTVRVFGMVVAETPQWHGTAAANWRYAINAPDTGFDDGYVVPNSVSIKDGRHGFAKLVSRLAKGSTEAMGEAAGHAADPSAVQLHDTVFITNSLIKATSDPEDNPLYVESIELGEVDLRQINEPGEMVKRTVQAYMGAFDVLDDGLAASWANSRMQPYQFMEYVLA